MNVMKSIVALVAFSCFSPVGQAAVKWAGYAPSRYTIMCSSQAEPEEAKEIAALLNERLAACQLGTLPVSFDGQALKGPRIDIIHSASMPVFSYKVKAQKGHITIDGGGSWALQAAVNSLCDQMTAKGKIPAGYSCQGTVEGKYLFPQAQDVNVRILDDNIWDYSHDTIPAAWRKAGIDCRDAARAPQFAQLVRAYMPGVLTLQEYNRHMHDVFYPLINRYGYTIAYESGDGPWNNTPVFYQDQVLELLHVNYHLYTPSQWSNHGSKSFTSAVFKEKKSGKVFAVINTHLWWKSDKKQPGSTFARAAQVRLMMAETEIIRARYHCPVFVVGDMNCEERSVPMQQLLEGGFQPCYKIASRYGNRDNGHHICSPTEVGERTSRRLGPDREKGAIDHCMRFDPEKKVDVKVFDCIQTYFTVPLTDHYPNLIDAAM